MKPPAKLSPAPVGSNTDGERARRGGEDLVAGEEQRAVLAALHDHGARAEAEDLPRRLHDVVLAGELARLGVVHEEQVHALQRLEQALALRGDPEVHRVARDEARRAHLVEHRALQVRVDVAEEDVLASRGSASGSSGRNSANTLSWVSSVWAVLRSNS